MHRNIIHILARQAYHDGENGAHNVYIWELASMLQRVFWQAKQDAPEEPQPTQEPTACPTA